MLGSGQGSLPELAARRISETIYLLLFKGLIASTIKMYDFTKQYQTQTGVFSKKFGRIHSTEFYRHISFKKCLHTINDIPIM